MKIEDFVFETTAEDVTEGLDLSKKTYVVTGCNSGLGLETVRVLALRGANIIGTARTEEKAKDALKSLGIEGLALACELSDPASVRACAKSINAHDASIDALICNAGVMALPAAQTTLGYDLQFLTNHIGHAILVTETLDSLAKAGRVVIVSSGAHRMAPKTGIEFDNLSGERDFDPWKMYGQSKLANILFTKKLAESFAGSARVANSLHPGVIKTNLSRHVEDPEAMFAKMRTKTVGEGAATQCAVATRPEYAKQTGLYFMDSRPGKCNKLANDKELATKLWDRTQEIIAAL
ncbi:MAG: NAD(P)-dependent dehydrogenase (short-subunit alcohol dehydrogenase family) [Polyangiales bacterium]|jgi:NAD(P)-dependent dehydrogenase (short-subunit alcohol dehydrogenase family)